MSFLGHGEIYPSDGGADGDADAPAHRLNEFPAGYSLAGWSPPEPASASPAGFQYALQSSCRSRRFQRTANSVLTGCLSRGGRCIGICSPRQSGREPTLRPIARRPSLKPPSFALLSPFGLLFNLHSNLVQRPDDLIGSFVDVSLGLRKAIIQVIAPLFSQALRLIRFESEYLIQGHEQLSQEHKKYNYYK